MFTFLTILTVIFVIIFIFRSFIDSEINFIDFLILILILIFGWVVLGHTVTEKSEYFELKSSKPAVTLSNNNFLVFYIDLNGVEQYQQFGNLSDLPIKDAKVFKMKRDFDIYNNIIRETIVGAADSENKVEQTK